MAKIMSASIDLSKINQDKIKKCDKGQQWYSISVILNDEKDKYDNDVVVIEGQTKEERESKTSKVYLGNGRVVWGSDSRNNVMPQGQGEPMSTTQGEPTDDLPF